MPPSAWRCVYARSGLSIKHGLCMANGVGVIDSDYRGELRVPMVNLSDDRLHHPARRARGPAVHRPGLAGRASRRPTRLSDTERGAGGFGSTGK